MGGSRKIKYFMEFCYSFKTNGSTNMRSFGRLRITKIQKEPVIMWIIVYNLFIFLTMMHNPSLIEKRIK